MSRQTRGIELPSERSFLHRGSRYFFSTIGEVDDSAPWYRSDAWTRDENQKVRDDSRTGMGVSEDVEEGRRTDIITIIVEY